MSPARTLLSGMVAGFVEGSLCVVPMTTLQVKFCHDLSLDTPKFKGLAHGTREIVRELGWKGVYQVSDSILFAELSVLFHCMCWCTVRRGTRQPC